METAGKKKKQKTRHTQKENSTLLTSSFDILFLIKTFFIPLFSASHDP